MAIYDEYNYNETNGFNSLAGKAFRDHQRLDTLLKKNYEFDKEQAEEISANTALNAAQEIQIKLNADVNASQEVKIENNRLAILAEVERATTVEADLQEQINTEVERAQTVETDLQAQINAEVQRAKEEENSIKTKHQEDVDLINKTLIEENAAILNIKTQLDAHSTLYSILKEKTEDNVDRINKSISSINDEIAKSATLNALNELKKTVENLSQRVSILENK